MKPADPDDPDAGRAVQSFFARLAPEDAVWLDSTIAELAQHLADEGMTSDEARAAALAMLARPDEAAAALGRGVETGSPAEPRRQRAVVHVHLQQAALEAQRGVARVEGLGPVLVQRLTDILRHAHIDLKPVIDLATGASVNGYEHPTAMKERVFLRSLGDVFPHAASLSRRVDIDHPIPYDPGGPPGQTSDGNAAPLSRRSHRAKTHYRYTVEQLGPASYLWTTPHGLLRLVTPDRTQALDAIRVEVHRAYRAA